VSEKERKRERERERERQKEERERVQDAKMETTNNNENNTNNSNNKQEIRAKPIYPTTSLKHLKQRLLLRPSRPFVRQCLLWVVHHYHGTRCTCDLMDEEMGVK
jgi:hypothetical protein